jgi:surfeit locus 1 family protein
MDNESRKREYDTESEGYGRNLGLLPKSL